MKKILIVEDDTITAVIYQRHLQKEGFVTDVAKDGAAGLERLATFGPDAVLLDLMMPKVSGIEMLKTLRAQEAFRTLPVLALTNAMVPTMIQQAMDAGATKVFDKSKTTPSTVVGLLRLWLENTSKAA